MKNTSKKQLITTISLILLLILSGIASATGSIKQLKETQLLDKINPSGKNVFRTLKKTILEENLIKELENSTKIEAFINNVVEADCHFIMFRGFQKVLLIK